MRLLALMKFHKENDAKKETKERRDRESIFRLLLSSFPPKNKGKKKRKSFRRKEIKERVFR